MTWPKRTPLASSALISARSSWWRLRTYARWRTGDCVRLASSSASGVQRQVLGVRQRLEEARRARDHRGVVGAQVEAGNPEADAELVADRGDPRTQRFVGGDAAADREALDALVLDRRA